MMYKVRNVDFCLKFRTYIFVNINIIINEKTKYFVENLFFINVDN